MSALAHIKLAVRLSELTQLTKGAEHAPELPAAFAVPAAYGDLIAAVLALLALAALRSGFGIPLVWVFNLWGSADLLYAFYQGNASGLAPGMLQATYFIPTFIVPLLLITHGFAFLILLRRDTAAAGIGTTYNKLRRGVGGQRGAPQMQAGGAGRDCGGA